MRRAVFALVMLVAAWIGLSLWLFVWPSAETGAPAHADAIVMLSGDHRRLPVAERLARNAVAPVLVLSTVSQPRPWPAAQALCNRGGYAGARVLCFDAHPYSTRGEARSVAALARRHGWRSIVVVSSTYHLTRARILFRRCWNGTLSFADASDPWWRQPWDWATEATKLVVQETLERGC